MYHGKFDPKKGTVYLERDNVTDRLQKSVYIYTSVITGTDTGPSCHNPVESRLIPLDSGSISLESSESVGHRKVQEEMQERWNETAKVKHATTKKETLDWMQHTGRLDPAEAQA